MGGSGDLEMDSLSTILLPRAELLLRRFLSLLFILFVSYTVEFALNPPSPLGSFGLLTRGWGDLRRFTTFALQLGDFEKLRK